MKLLPCPFCGGEAEVIFDGIYYVRCKACGEESLKWAYKREATKAWNTRTDPKEGERMDIQEIPLQELLKDKDESLEDIKVCAKALRLDIKSYSGGSVQNRLETNKEIVDKINDELARRHVAVMNNVPPPEEANMI